MKNSVKQTYILFIVFSLTLILTGGSFIDNTLSKHNPGFHKECSDFSKHFEYYHFVCFEDDIMINHSKIKTDTLQGIVESLPDLIISLRNNHITCIWQPPKFS